jgi:hypothetical protein
MIVVPVSFGFLFACFIIGGGLLLLTFTPDFVRGWRQDRLDRAKPTTTNPLVKIFLFAFFAVMLLLIVSTYWG